MWEIYTISYPVARKRYPCDACRILFDSFDIKDLTEEEQNVMLAAKSEGYAILPGTKYGKCAGKYDGEFDTFRARLDADAICRKYDLYDV